MVFNDKFRQNMLEKSLKGADKGVFTTTSLVVLITARIVSMFVSSTAVPMYDFSIFTGVYKYNMSSKWPMKHINVSMSFDYDYVTLHSSSHCILPEQPPLPLSLFPLPCLFLKSKRQYDILTIIQYIVS